MFVLSESLKKDLVAQPESGMGYQLVEFVTGDNRRLHGLAFNAEVVLTTNESRTVLTETKLVALAHLQMLVGNPSAVVREIHLLERNHWAALGYGVHESQTNYGAEPRPAKDAPVQRTSVGDVFVRFSAFENDRRINGDGGLKPGTYATTEADARLVRTGKAAVRRYALPNPDPAVHRFTLVPPEPANIQYGIVEPAYGQPGGGVEVIFPSGTAPKTFVRRDKIPAG